MDGDSSRDSSLFTKYKILIFFLFFSPMTRETTHKSLKRRLLLPFAMRHDSHLLFKGLRKIRVSTWHIADICTANINNMTRIYN